MREIITVFLLLHSALIACAESTVHRNEENEITSVEIAMRIEDYDALSSGEHILTCIGKLDGKDVGFNLIMHRNWTRLDWSDMPPEFDRSSASQYRTGAIITKLYPESVNLDELLVELYQLEWVDSIFADPGYEGRTTVSEEEMQNVPFRFTLGDAMLVGDHNWFAEMAVDLENREMIVLFLGDARSNPNITQIANQLVETMRANRTSH